MQRNLLRIIFLLFFTYLFNNISYAIEVFQTENDLFFTQRYRLGATEVNKEGTGLISFTPDFSFGDYSLGFDFNILMGEKKPTGAEGIVLRHAEYDTGYFGIDYGVIDEITFASGLLIKKFNTWVRGPLILNNEQTGLQSYFSADPIDVDFFCAWNNIFGVRVTEDIAGFITLGQSIVTDTNGMRVEELGGGDIKKYPPMTGYSVDLSIPIEYGFNLYSEAASLAKYGSATSIGVLWGYKLLFTSTSFRIERRFIEPNFVPDYFDSTYEINPVDIDQFSADPSRKDGVLAELRAQVPGIAFLNVIYENYEGSEPTLSEEANIKLFNFFVSAYFKQANFSKFRQLTFENSSIFRGSFGYRISNSFNIFSSYKRTYDPIVGEIDEMSFLELQYIL